VLTDRIGFWVIVACAWFATIGLRPLMEPDEGRYAEVPRELWVSGDWVTPRLNGVNYFEKPALQYWATAAVYSVFGVHEWTARLWACGLAFLCIPLTYWFARHAYGSAEVAGAAAAALALNPYFLIVGQLNLLDSALTFFLVASMFAFLRAREALPCSSEERRWMLLTSVTLALAVLMKGIVAPVLAGAVLVLHMAVTREVRPWRRWHLAVTVPVFIAIAVPWFVVVSVRNPEFPKFFFIHEHFARYLTNEAERVEPWWFFLQFIALALLPWIPIVWGAPRRPRNPVTWFLLLWCGVVVVFFSISHSKLPTYILPMMPALAVLLAPRIAEQPLAIRRAAWITFTLVALLAVGLVIAASRGGKTIPTPMLVWSSVAGISALAAALLSMHGRVAWGFPALGAIVAYQAVMMSYSALPPGRSAKSLVAAIRPLVKPDTQLFSVDQYRQSVPPYLGRTLRMVRYTGELKFGIEQGHSGFLPTLDAFIAEWSCARDAIAFLDPPVVKNLRERGVPFHVRAADGRSVVVSRR
jgi:4-amino-4-deoxy-L-arabinose transferase-like glycosyltransferase